MDILPISSNLPTEMEQSEVDELYDRLYQPGMGPISLVKAAGLDKSGYVEGEMYLWRVPGIGSLGWRDLTALKPFAISARVHNTLSLECIISGGVDVELCGKELPDTGMPRAYLASHQQNGRVTRILNAGDTIRSVGLWLPPSLLEDEFGLNPQETPPAIQDILSLKVQSTATLPLTGSMLSLLSDLIDMPFSGIRGEKFLHAKCLEMLCHFCEVLCSPKQHLHEDNPLSRQKAQAMKQVVQALNSNIASPPQPEELAAQVGMSRSSLTSTFKTSFGVTMSNYLLQRRMFLAHQLLQNGKLSIMEVGYAVGYEDQSAFGRAYKKFYDRPPKADRPV